MCHIGRSCETGAEMKRLAWGEVGCAFSMAVLTGLWYFSKECECFCVHRKKPAHISLGIVQVFANGSLPLYHCTVVYAAEHCLLLRVFMC